MRHGNIVPENQKLGTPTYNSVQDSLSQLNSSGRISGGVLTADGSGGVNYTQINGLIKTTDSDNGVVKYFTLAGGNIAKATLNEGVNYIYIKYNSGNPIIAIETDRNNIKTTNEFTLGRVFKTGATSSVDILQSGINVFNFQRRNHERLIARGIMERMSGCTIGASGIQVTSDAGVVYVGLNKITIEAKLAATNFEHYYYMSGASTWAELTATNNINVTQYNRLSDFTLQSLGAGRYTIGWVYVSFDGDYSIVMGQGNYTLAQANSATPPSVLPDYLSKFSILAGKVIVQRNASSLTSVESAFTQMFTPTAVNDHNDLSNIQGGAADDYYHLTSAQVSLIPQFYKRSIFTNTDLAAGHFTITHGVTFGGGVRTIMVVIFDNNNKQILPDDITCSDNTADIDLTSFGTLTGTWSYIAII